MVGMPVFIDQTDVLKRMEEKGIGLGVPKGAPADEIHAAIVEVCLKVDACSLYLLWRYVKKLTLVHYISTNLQRKGFSYRLKITAMYRPEPDFVF